MEQQDTHKGTLRLKMAGLYGPDLSSLFGQTTSCIFVAGGIDPTNKRVKLSELQVSAVVLFCMAISFLLARQLCCYRSDPGVEHARTCGLACNSNSCRSCSIHEEEDPDMLPCCKIQTCYLCFRALPVLLVVLLSPFLASLALCVLRRCCPACEKDGCLLAHWLRWKNYQSTAVQEIEATETGIEWERSCEEKSTTTKEESMASTNTPSPMISELVSVDYQRPDIVKVLQTLWSAHEDEAFASCTTVVVCGPQRLVDDVRQETDRQQSQNFDNQYKLIVM